MAKPPQYRAVPDHSGAPLQSGKVGVSFDSFESKTNQADNHNKPDGKATTISRSTRSLWNATA